MPSPNSADTERGPRQAAQRGDESGAHDRRGGEFAAIERLRDRLAAAVPGPPAGEVWVGDDTAVLRAVAGRLLFTTDLSVLGVHADLAVMSTADMGWRALVASVSDIAAMGGRPRHAVVAVSGPPDTDLDGLYEGVAEAAAAFGCPVVGGDLSGGPSLVVAVAATGEVSDDPSPVLRSGARPGDEIFVTGPLGGSAAGLRLLRDSRRATGSLVEAFRRPRPKVAEGEAARHAGASAMVDVSDGVAGDLGRLADASGVGFRVDGVPVRPGATLDEALGGGEDYELVVVTADGERLQAMFADAGLPSPVQIGVCVADTTMRTYAGEPVTSAGWEHEFDVVKGDGGLRQRGDG